VKSCSQGRDWAQAAAQEHSAFTAMHGNDTAWTNSEAHNRRSRKSQ